MVVFIYFIHFNNFKHSIVNKTTAKVPSSKQVQKYRKVFLVSEKIY